MKNLFLVVLIFCFGFSTYAQEELNFGVKAGVNFASLSGDDFDDFDGRTGFHIGALAEIFMGENFAIQPELVYSQQGAKFDSGGIESTTKFDYLNIPVMAKLYVGEDLAVEFGPQVGVLLSANQEFDGNDEDIKDFVKSTDISLGGGLSFNMETGWFAQARYMYGVTDLNDSGEGDSTNNGVISLSIGYMF